MNKGNPPRDRARPHSRSRRSNDLSRGLLGLAGALVFHVVFLGLIVFKPNPRPPVLPQPSEGYATVSLALVRDAAGFDSPQAGERSPAGSARPKQPTVTAPTAPVEVQAPLKAEPRPVPPAEAPPEPLPLFADRPLLAAQDLHSEPMPLHSQAAAPSAGSAPPAAGRPDCQLAPVIQKALQTDPAVVDALAGLPRQSRSVANAVMLWESDWTVKPPAAGSIAVIQGALKSAIAGADLSCLRQPLRGPQFITVTDGSGATVLVVGSGDWNWEQLLR